ncbi:hypothetical protein M0802_000776 [Mischocyttarus mexicanus]|nr:hypothetical protein M0802_000776 [Mischocyttarus mexicanus]
MILASQSTSTILISQHNENLIIPYSDGVASSINTSSLWQRSREYCSPLLLSSGNMDFIYHEPSIIVAEIHKQHHSGTHNNVMKQIHEIGEDGMWDEMKPIVTSTNSTIYTIENLTPFTVYSFRVAAVNAMGRSVPSQPSYCIITLRETFLANWDAEMQPTRTLSNTRECRIRAIKRELEHAYMRAIEDACTRPRDKTNMEMKDIYIRDPAVDNHSIHELKTYTQYLVSLQVFNPEGHGPATTVSVMTDEGGKMGSQNDARNSGVTTTTILTLRILLGAGLLSNLLSHVLAQTEDPQTSLETTTSTETMTMYEQTTTYIVPGSSSSSFPSTTENKADLFKVPTKPLNFTSRGITSTTIELLWSEPECANGVLSGYRVYFMYSNCTDVQMYRINENSGPNIEFVLKNLKPYVFYDIWVKAYTLHNEGEPSEHLFRRTDIAGPSEPQILNLTCQSYNAVYIQWARPTVFWGSVDYYYINYRQEINKYYEEIEITANKNHLESGIIVPNLTINMMYEFIVRGATKSTINDRLIVQGETSAPRNILVTHDCDKIPSLKRRGSKDLSAGVIAGMVCACFAIMLAITAFVLWKPIFRKCFHTAYYYLDYPPRNVPTLQEWENSEQDGERTAVSIQQFVQHVAKLHVDGDIGFSKEYEIIQSESGGYTVENSQFVENKAKNRYLNILAYDHTRVQLLSCGGGPPKKGQDYVNANYIDGWQCTQAYIGTQGPLPPTFDGFWRMVWEQQGSETYGYIQVTLIREDIMATYTIRTLQIRHLKIKKKKNGISMGERTIWQYHYTGWPDHGVPDHPLPVLSFIRKSSNANPPDAGPIVVHCSAGVGRTGTYIVIDAMLKQAKSKNEINVFGFLKHIRTQRNFLVQTEEQYIFIHDALQEAIESGETNIEANNLMQHIQDMLCPSNKKTDAWNNLDSQYKLVTSWKPKDFNLVSATKSFNFYKNRNVEILPIENARVHLTPKPGVDGSDYINATWFSGFQRNREFIITQHPMHNTIMEFWQMMWDHNAQTIVMLTQCDEEYPEFWPTEGNDLESETFRVRLCGIKETVNGIILREVAVRSLQDDYELSARIVQGPPNQVGLWPHNNNPKVFVSVIQDFHRDYQNGPIVVMDRYGGVEAALFVLLTTLNKQLEFEQSADIYMYSKLLYMKRPGVFRSKEDYVLLYQCLESMLSSKIRGEPDLYSMANGRMLASMCCNDPNEIRSASSMQHMAMDYPMKPSTSMIREYTTVEVSTEYLSDYTIPIRVDHPIESSSSNRGSETYLAAHGSNDHGISEKNIVVSQRNVSYHSHPPGVSVTVDANGYITNGSMRVPPEGMEASCKILPQ